MNCLYDFPQFLSTKEFLFSVFNYGIIQVVCITWNYSGKLRLKMMVKKFIVYCKHAEAAEDWNWKENRPWQ